MIFEQLNPKYCKTYLIGEDQFVLVDPVLEHIEIYLNLFKKKNFKLTHVIDTHTHADHLSAGPFLKDMFGCEYVMHKNASQKCVTIKVDDGDSISIGKLEFKFIYTPGHTKDSICILVGSNLMTGDFLFLDDAGGGRNDLPGGDVVDHWTSIQKLTSLPEDLMIYPAHEYNKREPSTLRKQRISNPHLIQRTKEEFEEYIGKMTFGPADWMKEVIKSNIECTKDPKAVSIPEDTHACQIVRDIDSSVSKLDVKFITSDELNKRLINNKSDIVLLDVREKYELSDQLGHLESIVHIPIGSLENRIIELEKYRNKTIVVICRSGVRAKTGAQILLSSGFKDVLVLEGGMISWRKGNFPVEQ